MNPLISICIPAYKRTEFLKRLLDSVCTQTFKDFEVVVTDDSPGSGVQELCNAYQDKFTLIYNRNEQPLGTPENWNEAIRKAKGKWIKLMHDDDWFAFPDSLEKLFNLAVVDKNCSFVFCGSTVIEDDKFVKTENISLFREKLLRKDPQNLFFRNFIGPPSVIMHKNDQQVWYDNRMKWLVDVDFYIRYLQHEKYFNFTREFLINVGFSEGQVTKEVAHDRNIVIPENLLLLSKLDEKILLRSWNYDFCWRLIRNYDIRNENDLIALLPNIASVKVPDALMYIAKVQKRVPKFLLRLGITSKTIMFMSYIVFRIARLFP